jgi:hypothetical protein
MLHPQIVVHEPDGRLAEQVRPLAVARRWAMREARQAGPLWRTLAGGGPTVFVVKVGDSPEREFALIERVSWQLPDVATVAVGDLENPAAAAMAWDLGAAYVLFPPISRDLLPEIVAGVMKRAIRDSLPATQAAEAP